MSYFKNKENIKSCEKLINHIFGVLTKNRMSFLSHSLIGLGRKQSCFFFIVEKKLQPPLYKFQEFLKLLEKNYHTETYVLLCCQEREEKNFLKSHFNRSTNLNDSQPLFHPQLFYGAVCDKTKTCIRFFNEFRDMYSLSQKEHKSTSLRKILNDTDIKYIHQISFISNISTQKLILKRIYI